MTGAIDGGSLLQRVWAAPLAVLTVTVAWGLVIRATTGALEARRNGHPALAGAYVLLAIAGAALFAAAVVVGLIVMVSTD